MAAHKKMFSKLAILEVADQSKPTEIKSDILH
jgi:hypothetical protein